MTNHPNRPTQYSRAVRAVRESAAGMNKLSDADRIVLDDLIVSCEVHISPSDELIARVKQILRPLNV